MLMCFSTISYKLCFVVNDRDVLHIAPYKLYAVYFVHVILNNCWNVSTRERKYDSEDAVQDCFLWGWMLERAIIWCAVSTKGHWKESLFCTEYKKRHWCL